MKESKQRTFVYLGIVYIYAFIRIISLCFLSSVIIIVLERKVRVDISTLQRTFEYLDIVYIYAIVRIISLCFLSSVISIVLERKVRVDISTLQRTFVYLSHSSCVHSLV